MWKRCSCLQTNSRRNTILILENHLLQLMLNHGRSLLYIFFSCTHKVMQLHVPECFFSMCWYERTRACYNTLLVFREQEEPGSAPVTQLLMTLVLSFELTPSTCLLICLYHSLSAPWNVFSEASSTKINSPNRLVF